MLFQLLLSVLFGAFAAAAPSESLGAKDICGFANHGDGKTESHYTYFDLGECRPLGKAWPVKKLYRDPGCDCTFYRDAECQTITWHLSVDYGMLREDMGEVSEYYKCTTKNDAMQEL